MYLILVPDPDHDNETYGIEWTDTGEGPFQYLETWTDKQGIEHGPGALDFAKAECGEPYLIVKVASASSQKVVNKLKERNEARPGVLLQ